MTFVLQVGKWAMTDETERAAIIVGDPDDPFVQGYAAGYGAAEGPLCQRISDLESTLRDAAAWIADECQPEVFFSGQGHNMSMSHDDRVKGIGILAAARAALSLWGNARDE